ncbi:MAG: protein-export chaperone SecB [Oscillibacter sp.]|nr:protein-export chaperone SecB [Oscillibacter sp.]
MLKLEHLVFDKLNFHRIGFKNENEVKFSFGFRFDIQSETQFTTRIRVQGVKEAEYDFTVEVSGYFIMENNPVGIDILSKQNATAIIFPYVRSQIALLTAQPEIEPIVLPPFNIAAMVTQAEKERQ